MPLWVRHTLRNPTKNDWVTQIMKDPERVKVNLELIEIQYMTKETFNILCKQKVKYKAFEEMTNKKSKNEFKTSITEVII